MTASNLGPYHRARYGLLAEFVNLYVVKTPVDEFYRPWEAVDADADFPILTPFHGVHSRTGLLKAVNDLLAETRPDVVVCVGYNRRYVWLTTLAARACRIPCLLYLVGWANERPRTPWKEFPKRLYVGTIFDGALVTGSRARAYAEQLGISEGAIHTIGNVIDNDHFARPFLTPQLRLPAQFFVTTARLSDDKNIAGLLDAFEHYRAEGGRWELCIAGTGPAAAALQARVPQSLQAQVHWLGWVGYDMLPELYQRAGCFVLPSLVEPWGLVVNEAMAAGLPVLVSQQCGCQPELVSEGENGFAFDPHDSVALARLMARIEGLTPDEYAAFVSASKHIVAGQSLDRWRRAFLSATNTFVNNRQSAIPNS